MVQLSAVVGAAALITSVVAAPAVRRSQYQNYQYEQEVPKYEPEKVVVDEQIVEDHEAVYQDKYYAPVHATTTAKAVEVPEYKYQYHETTSALAAEETYAYEPEHDTALLAEEEEYTYEYAPAHTPEYVPEHAEETTVLPEEAHETWSSDYAYPTYGSGASEWGAPYDDCVSQCVAKYGAPRETYTPVAKPEEVGNGAIHTVLVAPEAGVLRYYPFALNATVGDTIRYVWSTPANHTATLSSELALCNRSSLAEGRSFVSGIKNGAEGETVFDVVVQTEEPQFFYCSVQQHCEKGMWGVINPKSEFGGVNTVGSKMKEWTDSNPNLQAAWSYVHETTKTDQAVDTWGNSISLDGIPEEAYSDVAANVIWTRAMFGANPGTLETNKGAATPDGSPVTLVEDLSILLSATNQDPNAANQPAGTPTGALPNPSEAAEELAANAESDSGASKNIVGFWVAAVVGVASWILL